MSILPDSNQSENKHLNRRIKASQAHERAKVRFGKILRGLREDQNMSQMELANAMDVAPLTIYRWESGESLPYPIYRRKLCDFFDVDREKLFPAELRKSTAP